jgi:hypothetical protein
MRSCAKRHLDALDVSVVEENEHVAAVAMGNRFPGERPGREAKLIAFSAGRKVCGRKDDFSDVRARGHRW